MNAICYGGQAPFFTRRPFSSSCSRKAGRPLRGSLSRRHLSVPRPTPAILPPSRLPPSAPARRGDAARSRKWEVAAGVCVAAAGTGTPSFLSGEKRRRLRAWRTELERVSGAGMEEPQSEDPSGQAVGPAGPRPESGQEPPPRSLEVRSRPRPPQLRAPVPLSDLGFLGNDSLVHRLGPRRRLGSLDQVGRGLSWGAENGGAFGQF